MRELLPQRTANHIAIGLPQPSEGIGHFLVPFPTLRGGFGRDMVVRGLVADPASEVPIIGVHRYTEWLFGSTDGGTTWVRSPPFSHANRGTWPDRLYVHDDSVIATVGGLWIGTLS